MASFFIEGGKPLSGELRINGAKNAALPIIAASLLAQGEHQIEDVPQLLDIQVMLEILSVLGAKTTHVNHTLSINTCDLTTTVIPEELMGKMRSSIFLMGPLLARYGEVTISRPGGCAIGERPIDLHLSGLKALGTHVIEENDKIICQVDQLIGAPIYLTYPSVGATENIMMAATLAKGVTTIFNAAREPEIVDLQNFLNKMGAKVSGAGTHCIEIEGVSELHSIQYQIIPDRIITGTMLLATAITYGETTFTNRRPQHLIPLLSLLEMCGVEITYNHDIIKLNSCNKIVGMQETVTTAPHPGFPTDLQAQLMSFLTIAEGTSLIQENVFEERFKHVEELNRMGANISVDRNTAKIKGVSSLYGAEVEATDLRAGAALVIAGLQAQGTTTIQEIHHIDRGYEQLEKQLTALGAQIKRVNNDNKLN